MTVEALLERFEERRAVSGGWLVRCPAHADDKPSLSVSQGRDGKILLYCHAGCSFESVTQALGLDLRDLTPDPFDAGSPGQVIYDYRDESGTLLYQAVRLHGAPSTKKSFRQRRPDGLGGWIWNLNDVRRVVYRLDQLAGSESVIIVEGEKDADRLFSLGLRATTNSGGAGKWTDGHTQQLVESGIRRVIVLADNDPPGETHSLQVARSCHDAGLQVKRILLPDLPPKGDVSDWLDAGRDKAALLEVFRRAPLFLPRASVTVAPKLELTSLADLLLEPDETTQWLVEERIPYGSLVLLAGKPKAGKSTLARALALSVAAGEPWLGHQVSPGSVWYIALEDKRSELRRHFRQMGATGPVPLFVMVGEAPQDCIEKLEQRAKLEKPVLIIVDTLQRLLQVKDMSDYAEVTTRMSPLLKLARETGAALLLVHHANKYGQGLESILGSTALSGSVDNIFIVERNEQYRSLSSVQRIGKDMESRVFELNEQSGRVTLVGTRRDIEIERAGELILEALQMEGQPKSEPWLRENVAVRLKVHVVALRMLVRRGRLYRVGSGVRGSPFQYGVVGAGTSPSQPDRPQEPVNDSDSRSRRCTEDLGTRDVESALGTGTAALNQLPSKPPFLVPVVPDLDTVAVNDRSLSGLRGQGNSTYSRSAETADGEIDDSMFANPEDD